MSRGGGESPPRWRILRNSCPSAIDERVEPPLLCLGREVPTAVGPIDGLFLSRNGYLVLVATKLRRNPEAWREVVAQIIDYAAQLRRWTYADVETTYRRSTGSDSNLWEAVTPEGFDQQDWSMR